MLNHIEKKTENKPLFKIRGAGRIGKSMVHSWNVTYPLSKLEFYNDRILFQAWPKRVILRFEEIDSVELFKPNIFMVGGTGIKINHHSSKPPFLVFWSNKYDKTLSLFKEKGITLRE